MVIRKIENLILRHFVPQFFSALLITLVFSIASCEPEEVEVDDSLGFLPQQIIQDKPIFKDITPGADSALLPASVLEIALNYPINQVQRLNSQYEFRPRLKHLMILSQDGDIILGDTVWNEAANTILFYPRELFPQKDNLSYIMVDIGLSWEVKKDDTWQAIRISGSPVEEHVRRRRDVIPFPSFLKSFSTIEARGGGVDPFSTIQLLMNYPYDYNNGILKVDPVAVQLEVNGESTEISLLPGEDGKTYLIKHNKIMPFNAEVKIQARLNLQRKVMDGWKTVEVEGAVYEEVIESTYTTAGKESLEVLYTIFPQNNFGETSIYVQPKIDFNQSFGLYAHNDNLRLKLLNYELLRNGQVIEGAISWTNDSSTVTFKPLSSLEENTTYELQFNGQWEVKENGNWVLLDEDLVYAGNSTFITTTKENSALLFNDNLQYSYPVAYQYNFLPKEHAKGYYRFKNVSSEIENKIATASLLARFYTRDGFVIGEMPVSYAADSSTLNFDLPELENNTIYRLEIEGVHPATQLKEMSVVSLYFKTSHFDTFEEKFNAFSVTPGWTRNNDPYIEFGQTYRSELEAFDEVEALQSVIYEAHLAEDAYYQNEMYPYLYKGIIEYNYPLTRDLSRVGTIPVNGVRPRQYPILIKLSGEEIRTGNLEDRTKYGAFIYEMDKYYTSDYNDVKNYIQSKSPESRNDWETEFLNHRRESIQNYSKFKYFIKYKLPGINKITFEREMTLINPYGTK